MRVVWLAALIAITSTLAHAQDIHAQDIHAQDIHAQDIHSKDMADMISRYRREHGLSAVKIDPQLTAIAERQAKAMAASGIMDHDVAGSFSSRIAGVRMGMAAENIAAGSKTWAETFRMWQTSPGHNANLLQSKADTVGVAFARNENTRYKTFWAMVIADKSFKQTERRMVAAAGEGTGHRASSAETDNPIGTLKNFVCKYLC